MLQYAEVLGKALEEKGIEMEVSAAVITCKAGRKKFVLNVRQYPDLLTAHPGKMASFVQSRLGLNKKIFARNCLVTKINRQAAEQFLDAYHLMNSTQSASNYALFFKSELVAVASFSKGRRMNRLSADKRSFELIRFCCMAGISVTGGLTKLVKNFCNEKKAGDVMTYVDRRLSDGASFVKAGFIKHNETEQNVKLVYTP